MYVLVVNYKIQKVFDRNQLEIENVLVVKKIRGFKISSFFKYLKLFISDFY